MTLTVTNYVDRYSKKNLRRMTQKLVSGEAIIHLKEEAYFLQKQRD